MKVLVVDDNPDVRSILKYLLLKLGHSAVFTEDGDEAIAYMQQADTQPELVFLDLFMPRMDGFSVLQWMRANEATRTIKVVVMTAFYNEKNIASVTTAQYVISKSNLIDDVSRITKLTLVVGEQ